MDLYEDEAMQALTDCTLTEHACYPPLPPANDYVPISDESLEVKAFDLRTLQGRWYVAAGGNPAFDCFPCAQHEFRYNDKDKPPRLEATFSYRIARDDGSVFTRRGDKLITQKGNNGKLELRLDPDRMKYRDDWTVLANEPDEDYVVVYYHGTNVAWDGYGGLNVYTR
jgi:violaxanthin de-epoxidase